jgi:hypothetical protein
LLGLPFFHYIVVYHFLPHFGHAEGLGVRRGPYSAQRSTYYPERWEVPVDSRNRDALTFWPKATMGMARMVEHARDDQRWFGTVLCFEICRR